MMDWDHIRTDWQSHSANGTDRLLRVPSRLSRLWQCIQWRDGLETGVAVLLVLLFGPKAVHLFLQGLFVPAAFAFWLTLLCIYIPLKLLRARRLIPQPNPERSVIEFLRAERKALRGQRDLLGSVWRWYWGPIALGVTGFFISIRGWHWTSSAYVIAVLLVSLVIEYANRRAVRRNIEPALRELDKQIQTMEEDDAN